VPTHVFPFLFYMCGHLKPPQLVTHGFDDAHQTREGATESILNSNSELRDEFARLASNDLSGAIAGYFGQADSTC
jgi:hypothetical protein